MEYGIKFRPNKPGSPHLNGKVERSQKTDLEEFYPTVDLKSADLENLLSEWQHYYNWFRPHSSLGEKSPDERRLELCSVTPFWDEVGKNYHPGKERLQVQSYYDDLRLAKLKRSIRTPQGRQVTRQPVCFARISPSKPWQTPPCPS